MKKRIITALALLSATTMATSKTEITPTNSINTEPAVALNVYDLNSKTPKLIKDLKISRSKKQQLCWHSINVPLTGKMSIAEAFYTPAPTDFTSEGMSVHISEDKKEFLIVGDVIPNNKEYLMRCWNFDKKDPIGKYKLDIQIGDLVFKDLAFEITK